MRPNRREMIGGATAGAALACQRPASLPADDAVPSLRVIDTNVSLSRWPFRRLPWDDPSELQSKLIALGVTEAWAGSYEGVLHRDVAAVNQRLAIRCLELNRSSDSRSLQFRPFGVVNLALPNWQMDASRCLFSEAFHGVRLYPNYHGYSLSDGRFIQLLQMAKRTKRFVQIAVAMEDTRTQHSLVRAPDVDLMPLTDAIRASNGARVQLLNAKLSPAIASELGALPQLFFDTSRVDGTDAVPRLFRAAPQRVLFGSGAPLLIPEAAMIRVHESDQLETHELLAIFSGNAIKGMAT